MLLVTADDRTGALEVGGVLARKGKPVPVGPKAQDPERYVVDIASRHLSPNRAFEQMLAIHSRDARYRCHKMDSGLRGNWPHEARALVELGYKVAVIPSYPDAGRRCEEGVVYIHDVPLLESPFGSDPLAAPSSNKPIEVLEEEGCTHDEIEVWDASTNKELASQIAKCRAEGRVLVGTTGGIEVYGTELLPTNVGDTFALQRPILVSCGSLNSVSREQLSRVNVQWLDSDGPYRSFGNLGILATPVPTTKLTATGARKTARKIAAATLGFLNFARSLIVIGGDTVAAFLGNRTVDVIGTVDTGIPIASLEGKLIITKGGGIGHQDTLTELVQKAI